MTAPLDLILECIDKFEHRADSDFDTLKNELARKKGVSDPGAVAAKIGREKLGQPEMTRRSVAARK